MKLVRVEEKRPAEALNWRLHLKHWWGRWPVQLAAFLLVFLFGALVYRSGVFRPALVLLRGGISEPAALVEQMPAGVQEAAKSVEDEIRMYVNNGLPTLYIDLPFKNYQILLEKRKEALSVGVLNTSDADFVSAQVRLQDGSQQEVKMRLKGDWTDHLEGDKWSFRIQIKNDGQLLGMKQFNLQTPASRNFLNEWAFHQVLIKEGVLTTRYQFVNVLLNGKLLGIYALEEHFAPELLESQGRRQGLILRFNEDPMWNNISHFWSQHINQESILSVTNAWTASIDPFQAAKLAENPTLAAEAETARALLRAFQTGERPAAEIFDVELWGLFFALHDLWDAPHGAVWHNLRFYYNPVTALLEPVAFDSEPFYLHPTESTIITRFIPTRIFNDPQIRAAYAREVARLTSPEYMAAMINALTPEHDRLRDALNIEFPVENDDPETNVVVDWPSLERRAQSLALELQPAEVVRGAYQTVNVLPGSDGKPSLTLDLMNLMLLPVEVLRVEINGSPLALETPAALPPVIDPEQQKYEPVRITLPIKGDEGWGDAEPPEVAVVVRLTGLENEIRVVVDGNTLPEALLLGPTPIQPNLEEVLNQHAFLQVDPDQPNRLVATAGIWNVSGDLVLPANTNLVVLAGTVLRFSEGSILYVNGSLNLMGTADAPVLLTAQQESWGGVVVQRARRGSRWQYAAVEKYAGISREGWILTGGITFYQANITLDHAVIGNNQTEDAINVIHSSFEFRDSEFLNTMADAFDGDFVKGEISNCFFHDITGDAVDVSGSEVTLRDTRMARITDKGVSVGEQSHMRIQNVRMDVVGIGVASKDLSQATIVDSEIRNARFAALAAYIKKPVFGPAKLDAQNVTVLGTRDIAVVQRGSIILIDGKAIATVDLDVDVLYAQGVLGN